MYITDCIFKVTRVQLGVAGTIQIKKKVCISKGGYLLKKGVIKPADMDLHCFSFRLNLY